MKIEVDVSSLRLIHWYELAIRFFFGGAVTLAAGLIAKHYGPAVGGLFLAFPAIFPASATLIEKHETEKKAKAGYLDITRGRRAAALDARGAVFGALALVCFALSLRWLLPLCNAAFGLLAAVSIWLTVAIVLWFLRESACHP
jgi:hypothetical protein